LKDGIAQSSGNTTHEKRALYSNNDLASFQCNAWIGLTSRTPPFRRDDLADRFLIFYVKRYKGGQRPLPEEEMAAFLNDPVAVNQIFTSYMIDLAKTVQVLSVYKHIDVENRMADCAQMMYRIGTEVLGFSEAFMKETLDALNAESSFFTLEDSPIARVIPTLLNYLHNEIYDLAGQKRVDCNMDVSHLGGRAVAEFVARVPELKEITAGSDTFTTATKVGKQLNKYATELDNLWHIKRIANERHWVYDFTEAVKHLWDIPDDVGDALPAEPERHSRKKKEAVDDTIPEGAVPFNIDSFIIEKQERLDE
jgi:hypothetical protein